AERPAAGFARQAPAESWIDDAARKEQPLGRSEKVGILGEERSLFRIEDLVALVDRHLQVIGLNLAEVGIDRGVERERIAKHRLGIQTEASRFRLGEGGEFRVEVARTGKGAVVYQLRVVTRRGPADAVEISHR